MSIFVESRLAFYNNFRVENDKDEILSYLKLKYFSDFKSNIFDFKKCILWINL